MKANYYNNNKDNKEQLNPVLAPQNVSYQHAYSLLTVWAAFAFAVILGFSRLSYGLLLPTIRADLSGSYGSYGLVGTANFVGYLLGTLATPVLLTRYSNRIRLNLGALLAMSVAMMASSTSFDLWQLGWWRLVVGFFSALATVLTMALMLERVLPDERGRASGLVWMGGSCGTVVSGLLAPAVISLGASWSWRIVWVLMGLVGLVAALGLRRVILASPPPPTVTAIKNVESEVSAQPRKLGAIIAELFQPQGLLLLTIAYFGFGFGYIIYSTFFIPLLVQQGLPALWAGLVWSVLGAAGIIGNLIWGRAIDRWPNGYTLAATLFVGMLGALSVLTTTLSLEVVGAILTGLSFLGPPLVVTVLLKKVVPAQDYTSSFSFLTAVFALGQISGPLVGGTVVDASGLVAGIGITALVMGISTFFGIGYALVQKKSSLG